MIYICRIIFKLDKMIKPRKKDNVYKLKMFENIGDAQKISFKLVKRDANVRSYVSGFAKKNKIGLACIKCDDHYKIVRTV